MPETWRERALKLIDEEYHDLSRRHPDLSPAEICARMNRDCPFRTNDAYARGEWSKALGDYRIARTRPDLVERFKLDGPLF